MRLEGEREEEKMKERRRIPRGERGVGRKKRGREEEEEGASTVIAPCLLHLLSTVAWSRSRSSNMARERTNQYLGFGCSQEFKEVSGWFQEVLRGFRASYLMTWGTGRKSEEAAATAITLGGSLDTANRREGIRQRTSKKKIVGLTLARQDHLPDSKPG